MKALERDEDILRDLAYIFRYFPEILEARAACRIRDIAVRGRFGIVFRRARREELFGELFYGVAAQCVQRGYRQNRVSGY